MTRIPVRSLAVSLVLCGLAGSVHADALATRGAPQRGDRAVGLFDAAPEGPMTLRPEAFVELRDRRGEAVIGGVPLPDGRLVDLEVERFRVTSDRTRFVLGRPTGADEPLAFDPDDVVLLRGRVRGEPASHVYLALTERTARGRVEIGPGSAPLLLDAAIGEGGAAFVTPRGGNEVPLNNVCGVADPEPHDPGVVRSSDGAGEGGAAGISAGTGPWQVHSIDLAVDTDFEFYELFGSTDDAAAYVVALYGAVTDIYLRDVQARFHLSFVRIWDEPEELYDELDPLGPFRSHWNNEMTEVDRDLAQLLTGRRNLPYGGVAYLSAVCPELTSNGYSVSGYLLGSFTDPAAPGSDNWDVVVTAHELGHNCGSVHTHSYGIDNCAGGDVQRGSILSYCHTRTGGTANIDMRLNYGVPGTTSNPRDAIMAHLADRPCLVFDCNGNGIDDALDVAGGGSADENVNGIPDECEDCDDDGILDPQEILAGAPDMNGNGRPDACDPDCNGNGVPDDLDLAEGTSVDLHGDGVPDECDADCDASGTSDYNEIQDDMSLDVDRNAALDTCQDCDGDGIDDLETLAGALNVWVGSATLGSVREFHATTGVPVGESDELGDDVQDVVVGPDGLLYASSAVGDSVTRVDPASGDVVDAFVPLGAGGLAEPAGLAFRPGGSLLVASRATDSVLAYGPDGAALGAFVSVGAGGLVAPFGLALGPDGDLFVTTGDDRVLRFDGATGAPLGTFVAAGSGGLSSPRGLLFVPDGRLLVASFGSDAVLAYDAATGDFLGQFDRGGLTSGFWWLEEPWGLRLAPRGDVVLVSSHAGNAAVHSYDLASGLFLRTFYVLSTNVGQPTGFDIAPASPVDCNLNLVPDVCDIADGTSSDDDGDGVPDECGVAVCLADIDGSGVVDVDDLVALLLAWGPCAGQCAADLNDDAQVDVDDLILVLLAWGDCDGS